MVNVHIHHTYIMMYPAFFSPTLALLAHIFWSIRYILNCQLKNTLTVFLTTDGKTHEDIWIQFDNALSDPEVEHMNVQFR
jgi:hypothetical protein